MSRAGPGPPPIGSPYASGASDGIAPASTLVGTRRAIPDVALTDLIAAQATCTPDRTAIVWNGGEPWTYARLLQTADTIARRLLGAGVARGEAVAVYVPRRPDMLAATLGVMRAGAAYLPLDPTFPDARLHDMLEQSGVRHAVVWDGARVPPTLAGLAHVLALDGVAIDAGDAALPAVTGRDLAYILFTSGSTGRPKGVAARHRGIVNLLTDMQHTLGIGVDDVVGAFTSLSFDPSVLDLFLPLVAGARVFIANGTEQLDPVAFPRIAREHWVTTTCCTPTTLGLMARAGRLGDLRGMTLWVGGEELPRSVAAAARAECRALWNQYGPTEATVAVTLHRVDDGAGPVPLGRPLANTVIRVLDDTRSPVADGEIGEIWIGGAGLADGYLHDPARTTERFVPDPFAADGSAMYRTGDLGSVRDGLLYFHGRVDDQIKLDTFRIEPGEIEAAALAELGVHQAAAVARTLDDGNRCLVLYVAGDAGGGLATRLHATLIRRLPAYMRPHYIEVLDELPRTPTGKVDRAALPPPRAIRHDATTTGRPLATPAGNGDAPRPSWSPLVPLQPHGNRPPLFIIHGSDGNVLDFVALARGLDADQPAIGIRAFGLDGIARPVGSIPAMAAGYIVAIRQVQSRGPYFLAGASLGGIIACEMARQLRRQGEAIGVLAVIDTADGDRDRARRGAPLRFALAPFLRLRNAIDAVRVRRARAAGSPLPHALRHRDIERTHRRALHAYRPEPWVGQAVRFRATGAAPHAPASAATVPRDGLPDRVTTVALACRRDAFIEQPELLAALRAALQRAQAAPAS